MEAAGIMMLNQKRTQLLKQAFQQFQYLSATYVQIPTTTPVALFLEIYRELVPTVLSAV
jgi:hypothetical protein